MFEPPVCVGGDFTVRVVGDGVAGGTVRVGGESGGALVVLVEVLDFAGVPPGP